jgi:Fasciclin domain
MIPPTVPDLLSLVAQYTNYNVSKMFSLLQTSIIDTPSLWDELNGGSNVTLFAPVDEFWDDNYSFLFERFMFPGSTPHLRDLWLNLMLPKAFSREALLDMASGGSTNLSTLGGMNLTLDVSANNVISIGGGVLLDPSMNATNG